jgi:hypothetical protein
VGASWAVEKPPVCHEWRVSFSTGCAGAILLWSTATWCALQCRPICIDAAVWLHCSGTMCRGAWIIGPFGRYGRVGWGPAACIQCMHSVVGQQPRC